MRTFVSALFLPVLRTRLAWAAWFVVIALLVPLFPVYGAWDGTPYEPGETLEPECAPTDTDCRVVPASLTLSGETITSFTGQGIGIAGGALTLNATGDWTGTFDGQEGSWYRDNSFATSSADYWKSQRDFFSTTSAQYFIANTAGLSFSTSTNDAWLSSKTTDDLAEGSSNLYYADARVDSFINGSSTIAKTSATQVWTGAQSIGAPLLTVTGLADGCVELAAGKLTTTGLNCGSGGGGILSLNGLTASGQSFATSSDANIGLAIISSGATHTFAPTWTGVLSTLRGGTGLSSVSQGGLLIGGAGNTVAQIATSSLGLPTFASLGAYLPSAVWYATTTDALAEGSSNRYYTDARARSALSSGIPGIEYDSLAGSFELAAGYAVPLSSSMSDWGAAFSWGDHALEGYIKDGNTDWDNLYGLYDLDTDTTDDLAEGSSNLFYADSLVDAYLASLDGGRFFSTTSADAWLGSRSTSDVAEGSNLYFTSVRFDAALGAKDTDDVSEGSGNLYYTDARVSSYLGSLPGGAFFSTTSAAYFLSQNRGQAFSTTSADYWKSQRDFFSMTSVQSVIAQTPGLTFSTSTVDYWFSTKDTDSLVEGNTNRYYTDARARSALSAGSGLAYSTSTGAFALNASGDWTGTFDGQEGAYYLNRANHTGTQLASTISNFSAAADARINATSTIGTLTSAPSLATLSSGLTGLVKATSGALSNAVAGTDYESPLTFAYPLQRSANSVSLAFGTTTNNAWSGTNAFTNGVTTNALTLGSVNGFLKATGGSVAPALVSLTGDVSGTLQVANGGTGQASIQAGRLVYGNGTGAIATTTGETAGYVLQYDGTKPAWVATSTLGFSSGNAGTVTSVGLSAPTGFSVSGSPVTGSGTLALSFATGYGLPLTASTTAWQSFYDAPSSRITAGTNLSWSGMTLNGPTDAYMRGLFSASAPLSYNASTGALTLGTVGVANGGTGLITAPALGQLLVGNGSGGYALTATSSLGISLSSLTGTLGISQGGTGATAFGQGWIYSTGSGALAASSSPTVAWLTATSTTQASSFGMIKIGNPATYPDNPLAIQGSTNGYLQVNIQNTSSGNAASTDYIATANNGSDTSYFIDMGINGSAYNQAAFNIGGANTGYLYTSDGGLAIGTASTTNANAALIFHTGGTTSAAERMRITTAGRVGIGTSTPGTTLDVNGSITTQAAKNCQGVLSALGTDSTGRIYCISISLSDQRLKSDIAPLTDAQGLALIESLNPVSYHWKDPSVYGATDALQYGFIAQEAGEVAPNLTGDAPETALTPGGSRFFNYFGVIAPLVKSVQELSHRIAALADSVVTKRLCLEDVCITKEELRTMLEDVHAAPAPQPPPQEVHPAPSEPEEPEEIPEPETAPLPESGEGEAGELQPVQI